MSTVFGRRMGEEWEKPSFPLQFRHAGYTDSIQKSAA
jgi:hypothetical protein